MKKKILFSFICTLGMVLLTSCKEKQEAPTQEVAVQAPQIENEVDNAPKFVDYGDDELGQALMTYQKNGFWFKNEKPKLIENKATRIDFYESFTDESGKTWQFAKLSRNFDFDGEYVEKQWPVLYIYEGEENLRKAIETFVANFRKINKDKKTDDPRILISSEVKEISGGIAIKDSYVGESVDYSEYYENKKVFLFGFNYSNKEIEFMFDLK